jgi:DNA-directed RNA polymerase subunit RPC12/RpoP
MGESNAVTTQKRSVKYCPICGHKFESDEGKEPRCNECGFDLALVFSPESEVVPNEEPASVPHFAFLMIGLQIIISIIIGIAFFVFSDPLYLNISQIIALWNFITVFILLAFFILLHLRTALTITKISILIFGLITLPIGMCAIAGALSVATTRRYCIICGKQITLIASHSKCPHCGISFHRLGSCRNIHRSLLFKKLGRNPTQIEIDLICPHCFEFTSTPLEEK